MLYAHSRKGAPESDWEPLDVHLRGVAELAATFAGAFQAEEWGSLAGLWHDLGKARPEFQARLRGSRIQAEHAAVGGAHAVATNPNEGLPLAFAIAGHHSGLPNWRARGDSGLPTLEEKLARNRELAASAVADVGDRYRVQIPPFPAWLQKLLRSDLPGIEKRRTVLLAVELFTRFLLSALVDADRLATAAFCSADERRGYMRPALQELDKRLDTHLSALGLALGADSAVNALRRLVLDACRARSADPQGIFTLTVPTGGGKTLSGMSFALKHALRHALYRVIVVLPYTSIIEQNAEVYRRALGPECVIEHHSNFDEERSADEYGELEMARQYATENWDAPVIVTTSVQFLETLFSNRASRCRKLHNVARSVVVLDEVQTLPPGLLSPILDVLSELVKHYGSTIVLATATPPALKYNPRRPFGFKDTCEIVPDVQNLANRLRRVRVSWPRSRDEVLTYDRLAEQIARHHQVLVVVHLREDARHLAELLPREGRFHLSALMCPAHRFEVLSEVRRALSTGALCRLVSTQLVEAGVDIDFPVVYRALAGLDSLAQAAGRCNREGRLTDASGQSRPGEFVVFRAETKPPVGVLRMALDSAETLLAARGTALDIHDPATCHEFFDSLYFKVDPDVNDIQGRRRELNFADVAAAFRVIDDFMCPVVVPYGDAPRRLADYLGNPCRTTKRALQRFSVAITPRQLDVFRKVGAVTQVDECVSAVSEPYHRLYDAECGLRVEVGDIQADPRALIV